MYVCMGTPQKYEIQKAAGIWGYIPSWAKERDRVWGF